MTPFIGDCIFTSAISSGLGMYAYVISFCRFPHRTTAKKDQEGAPWPALLGEYSHPEALQP